MTAPDSGTPDPIDVDEDEEFDRIMTRHVAQSLGTPDPIERIARALYEHDWSNRDWERRPTEYTRRSYRKRARAVWPVVADLIAEARAEALADVRDRGYWAGFEHGENHMLAHQVDAQREALLDAADELLGDDTAEPGTLKHLHNKIYAAWLRARAEALHPGQGDGSA